MSEDGRTDNLNSLRDIKHEDPIIRSFTSHQTLMGTHSIFVAWVTNAERNTTYHFRAVAVGDVISYGNDETFRTVPWPF